MKGLLRLKSSLLGLRVESTAATQYHECLSETHTTTRFQPKVACGPPNRAPCATGEPPLRKVGCLEYELLPLALPSALHGRYHLSPQRSLDPPGLACRPSARFRVAARVGALRAFSRRPHVPGRPAPAPSEFQRVERGNPDSGGELWNRI